MIFSTLVKPGLVAQHLEDPDWVIIDCRYSLQDPEKGRRHYHEAHIPGAFYAHLDEDLSSPVIPGKTGRHPLPDVNKLIALFSNMGIDSGKQVVVYDYKSGSIAARCWWLLQWLGHQAVAVMDGGWHAWEEEKRPQSNELPGPAFASFSGIPQDGWVLDASQTAAAPLIVDSRNPERFRGEEEPIDPVAGHIPRAVNFPFVEHVDAEGRHLDRTLIRQRVEQLLGDHAENETVFYCGSGVTACHNLLALRYAGFEMARLYAGSWSDWITDPHRGVIQKTRSDE
jgi:thiosulfate/3-mercaptopyruvate sulfurtransferase